MVLAYVDGFMMVHAGEQCKLIPLIHVNPPQNIAVIWLSRVAGRWCKVCNSWVVEGQLTNDWRYNHSISIPCIWMLQAGIVNNNLPPVIRAWGKSSNGLMWTIAGHDCCVSTKVFSEGVNHHCPYWEFPDINESYPAVLRSPLLFLLWSPLFMVLSTVICQQLIALWSTTYRPFPGGSFVQRAGKICSYDSNCLSSALG